VIKSCDSTLQHFFFESKKKNMRRFDSDGGGSGQVGLSVDETDGSSSKPPSPLFPTVFFTDSNLDEDALSPIMKPMKTPSPKNDSDPFRIDKPGATRARTNSEPFHRKQFESIRVGVIAMDKKMESKAMQVGFTLCLLSLSLSDNNKRQLSLRQFF